MTVAAALLGLAVVMMLWLTRGIVPSSNDLEWPPPHPTTAPAPSEEPQDPRVLAQIREAYQRQLAETAPPGMIELMQGGGRPAAGELPPLPDPFVVPAGYRPDTAPAADLPPLPADLAARPELLPPPDESPAAGSVLKAASAADDLPPLPADPPR
jgi:hypothetical protein